MFVKLFVKSNKKKNGTENIKLKRDDFGKNDQDRTGKDLKARENSLAVLIPGFGFNYNLPKNLSLFGGIHKGFSPPGNTPGERAEERTRHDHITLHATRSHQPQNVCNTHSTYN